ncbi:glutamate ABC transporter substrate-binding protein [Phytohabitans houttuyneae]|uniref:ABC transporter substrate-binding protein n=1 Tax=Phytohabitans houttuyneae TaxID=1076126 RepID=A0A6V8K898_9ACTN|nr:glutamate ABC transporter substrate-binding protein [Phytohabitans houttuyneae]GFJ79984.1 ABC transporter substrate-binding protein [Phytohabitans houttuyneae]
MKARIGGLLLVAALLAGCGSEQAALPVGEKLPPPRPVGVEDPAPAPKSSPEEGGCEPRASYRPRGGLPAPGAMPAGSTMARIAARGHLVIGVSQTTYLFGYRDPESGEIVGVDIDIARQVSRALFGDPNKIRFRSMAAAERIPAIKAREVDMIIRTTSMNCERWRDVAFSTSYYEAQQRVLVRSDSKVRGIQDLGGKKVCAAAGSSDLANIAAAPSGPVPVSAVEVLDCLVLLQQGQVDAVSNDDAQLAGFVAQDPTTRVVGPAIRTEPYGIMMSQSTVDLVRFVNGVLARMRSDGSLAAIYRKWLTPLGEVPTPPAAEYRD